MLRRLTEFSRQHHMFSPGCRVFCAVSGGADSMALLSALRAVSQELGLDSLTAAHFNHMLRGEASDADEAFVRAFCEKEGIDFICGRGDVAAEATRSGTGTEETARKLRYRFLCEAAGGDGIIATAHTADDNAETILMNLGRGAGLRGLCGIPPVRGHIVRPLLFASRSEVLSYLESVGVAYVQDETNGDLRYARNRLRHTVIPSLKVRYPDLPEKAGQTARLLRRDLDYIEKQARGVFFQLCRVEAGCAVCDARALARLDSAVSSRVLPLMYEAAGGMPGGLNLRHLDDLEALLSHPRPSASVDLPEGLSAWREYERLILGRAAASPGFCCVPLPEQGIISISGTDYSVLCRPAGINEKIKNLFNTFYINCDMINGTLRIRPRQEGDVLRTRFSGHTKSLKKLMIEKKIPRRLRDKIPVLADEAGVVAVAGMGVDLRCAAATAKNTLFVEFSKKGDEDHA